MSQNRIFSLNSLSTSWGGKKPYIGLTIGTPRKPGQFLMLSNDYWVKAQLYVSNRCHKEMSNNNAQTSKSARYFNHKIFIKALKCLSSSLSFPVTHEIAIFSSGSVTIKYCCSVFWYEITQEIKTFWSPTRQIHSKDYNMLWLSKIFADNDGTQNYYMI